MLMASLLLDFFRFCDLSLGPSLDPPGNTGIVTPPLIGCTPRPGGGFAFVSDESVEEEVAVAGGDSVSMLAWLTSVATSNKASLIS